jgi:hypothetical protein
LEVAKRQHTSFARGVDREVEHVSQGFFIERRHGEEASHDASRAAISMDIEGRRWKARRR